MADERKTAREYLRVSRDVSGRLVSVDEQHRDHEEAAAEDNVELGTPYLEEGAVSASRYGKKARKGYGSLLDDLHENRFGAGQLWLWESSRGSRKVGEWATLLDLLADRGILIRVHVHERVYDPRKPRDRATLIDDANKAEYAVGEMSLRAFRAVRRRALAGRPHGPLVYGYRREYELTSGGRRIYRGTVADEETSKIVREIFERVAAGEPVYAIAVDLTRRGVPTPQPYRARPGNVGWSRATVRNIVRNRAYLGQRIYRGEVVETVDPDTGEPVMPWEPIVSQDTFDVANARLDDHDRPRRPDTTASHLLSGIARSGACENTLYYRPGESRPRYTCTEHGCVSRDAARLEDYVVPRAVAVMAKRQDLMVDDDADRELADAVAELEALRARHQMWINEGAKPDGPSPTAVAAAEAKLLPAIEQAERKARTLRLPAALSKIDRPIAEVWDDLDLATHRELIREAVTITVHPIGRGRRWDDAAVIVEER